ncbi:hypothetical protein CHLNCDRAFT_138847 [Chlorella variabilis]|uniref:Uncharacterized protein n=1 Tax=Chlorella variabilis TaxID=554065 RepID=E1ZP64_CHLVA|nr:hypothetical protein CHLNCDRAFT_138847 [Chlorella variabilis]EFN52391.1 hypothetical protein CHLNCDRAFT_138847 [Chlorella variabilis]|eukprot:XP_005844493.1 hypothetical protein CHLNCDRAFT_138847 [Chlorella variabilis]
MPASVGRLAALLVLLLAAASSGFAEPDAQDGARVLEAGVPHRADSTRIGGPPARYHLAGLQRGKGYEVRVSFPGTAAVRVRLWLDSAAAADGSGSGGGLTHRSHVHSRKLLDAEKVMFGTDAEGRVWLPEQRKALSAAAVLFKAEAWGRWRQPGQAPQLLLYDIVLEQSTLGVPHSALPLLATAALLVLLAAAAAPWWSGSVVPAILRWLHGERSAGSGREEAPQAAAAAATRPRPRRAPSVR